jgi:hypothetical protein
MAMGGRGRREAQAAIASCRPFRNSTGSLRGTRGSTRDLGHLQGKASGRELATIKDLLGRAVYVVWSYGTPIGCVVEDEHGNIARVYFDYHYSVTTSHHQSVLRIGFSDFDTVGEGPWVASRRSERAARAARQPSRGVRYGEGYALRSHGPEAEAAARARIPEHLRGDGQPYQSDRLEPTNYTPAEVESAAQARLAALLDPRYADPDWTPWGQDPELTGFNLPVGAEHRDQERIRNEIRRDERRGGWRPAHP